MSATPLPLLAKSTPEQDDLFDHLYEYGVSAEGVHQRLEKVCQAYATAARADLEAENKRLREALQWMVDNDDTNEGDEPVDILNGATWNEYNAYWIEGLNKARAALEGKP